MFVAHMGNIIARFLLVLAGAQFFSYLVAVGYGEDGPAGVLLGIGAFTAFCGFGLSIAFRGRKIDPDRRVDVFLPLGTLLLLPVLAALPFIFGGVVSGFWTGYFEAVSALTTTGASLIDAPEGLARGLLFYRALLEWGGGLLSVIMVLGVLTYTNIGALQLYDCGLPKGEGEATAKRLKKYSVDLILPYLVLTILCTGLLWATGVGGFKGATLSLTTLSSGGFVEQAGQPALIANPAGEWVLTLFMLAAGLNLPLFWFLLRGRRQRFPEREHTAIYLWLSLAAVAAVAVAGFSQQLPFFEAVRGIVFSAVSAFSTTGFISDAGPPTSLVLLLVLISLAFLGASVASTGGGIKTMRLIILFRHLLSEIRRLSHPHDATAPHFAGRMIDDGLLGRIWLLIFAFGLTLTLATLGFSALGYSISSAVALAVSALSNTGPLIFMVDPGFSGMAELGGWGLNLFGLLMVLGRLEIVAALSVMAAGFWRK
ncbi:MAG: potassium transporter TrkG [Sphingomonadales bacterium]